MLEETDFNLISLHDSILHSIHVDLKIKHALLKLAVFEDNNEKAISYNLSFTELVRVSIPFDHPWGDSAFINDTGLDNDIYWIEMQSGDRIEIIARGFQFTKTQD